MLVENIRKDAIHTITPHLPPNCFGALNYIHSHKCDFTSTIWQSVEVMADWCLETLHFIKRILLIPIQRETILFRDWVRLFHSFNNCGTLSGPFPPGKTLWKHEITTWNKDSGGTFPTMISPVPWVSNETHGPVSFYWCQLIQSCILPDQ